MDCSKKAKLSLNKKELRKTETAFLNYVYSKTQDKQKKLELLGLNLRNRKQNDQSFDVNDLMGFTFNYQSEFIRYFYEICFYDDDVDLYRLLVDLGLKDTCSNSIAFHAWFFNYKANRCIQEIFLQKDIKQHFVISSDSPVFSAIVCHNQEALELMCSHSQFQPEYFQHETLFKKNPMQAAADIFNAKALDFLIEKNAPHIRVKEKSCLASFDIAVNRYLDFFTGKKFVNYLRAKLNLTPVIQDKEYQDLFDKKYMFAQNIIKVFTLLLNKTPHHDFYYQLYLLPEKKAYCHDIFETLKEVTLELNIQKAPFKLLLDVLLSTGPGLFFKELPNSLKVFYDDLPDGAEIVLPILQQDEKTFQYFYFRDDFKAYLNTQLPCFKMAAGMSQYIECRQKKVQVDSDDSLFLVEVLDTLSMHSDVKQNHHRGLIASTEIKSEDKKFVDQLKDILNTTISENTNLMDFTILASELTTVHLHLADPNKVDQLKLSGEDFKEIAKSNERSLKSLFVKWVKLDKIFRQGLPVREPNALIFLQKSYQDFLSSIQKIDYYSMITLYVYLHMKSLSVAEKIELLNVFLALIKTIKSKNDLKRISGGYKPFLRLEFILHAFLIHAYNENNQPKLAKRELEQSILIMRVEPCGKLFYDTFKGRAHKILVLQAFNHVTKALMTSSQPNDLIRWLEQIKAYELGVLFPTVENINTISLIDYVIKIIEAELFNESKALIDLFPFDKTFLIGHENIKINEFLKKLEWEISELGLSSYVLIHFEQRRLEATYEKIGVVSSRIKKELPVELKFDQEKLFVEHLHLLSNNQVMNVLECIQKIRHVSESAKLVSKTDSTLQSISEVEESLTPQIHYLSLYSYKNQNKRQPIKKGKVDKSEYQEITPTEEKALNKNNDHEAFHVDRAELKKIAGIDASYTDLVMIKNHCSSRSKRFLAIKKLPQFQSFLNVCYTDAQNQNQLSVDSINPYGENQHGVKYLDVKNGIEKEYKIKIKANGSQRMLGKGKEVDYEETTFVVYQADEAVSHKKAENLFK